MNLLRKIKFTIEKRAFIKKYQKLIEGSSDYDRFLQNFDEKDDFKTFLWCVEIYDVLDNNDFAKVINKLHSLKRLSSLYEVEVNYRRNILSKLQYARVEIDYTSTGLVGSIKFKKNSYIRSITIRRTQINNNEIVLCYSIHLKKFIGSNNEVHACVVDNFKTIKKSNNFTWYVTDRLFRDKIFKEVMQLEFEWLRDWLQGMVEQLLYSKMGKRYKLPILLNYNLSDCNDKIMSELKSPFLSTCFADEKDEKFLHIEFSSRNEGRQINRYTCGKYLTESKFISYFSTYGNEFYYYIFTNIENAEIERRLGRYFTSLKRRVDIQDQKWLINKIRALKERKVSERAEMDLWIGYYDGKRTDEKLLNYPENTTKYLEMYEQYLDYLKAISSLSYNSTVLWVAGLTLVVSIIGVILTILLT